MNRNFLLISHGTYGDLGPLLTGARQLRARGHGVRVMAEPHMRPDVDAAGFEFIGWKRAPAKTEGQGMRFSTLEEWFERVVFRPTGAYAADTLDEINRVPTDAMAYVDLAFGCGIGARAAGLPCAVFSPHVCIRPLPGMPVVASGLPPPRTPEEHARTNATGAWLVRVMDSFLPSFNEVRQSLGVPPIASIFDLFDEADRVLLAFSQSFDFPADRLPANFRYIGPLLDEPHWAKAWTSPWTAGSTRPRVLVSCSSGEQNQQSMFEKVVRALGKLDVEALATAGPNVRIESIQAPRNVQVVSAAPHDQIMREVSGVVTHGGQGTVSRALLHGLPMVVIPNGRDQNDVAARVHEHGAGLRLPPAASKAEIADALKRILNEPHFRTAAAKLGVAVKADIEARGFVREMEEVAARGRAAPADKRQAVPTKWPAAAAPAVELNAAPSQLGEPSFTLLDGVRLAHFEFGPPEPKPPPLVLIHGWTGDHRIFKPQIELFAKARRVVAVHLRGHGVSDAPKQDYTIAGFADDIARQCQSAGVEKPVVIAVSFGGNVALELCGRHPDFASGLVMIDSMIMIPQTVRGNPGVGPYLGVLDGPDFLKPLTKNAWDLGQDFDSPKRRKSIFDTYILPTLERTPQYVLASSMRNLLVGHDPLPAAQACKIPMAYISADVPAIEMARDLKKLKELCPQLVTAKTLLAGHFNTIEVSDQINAMLDRFLKVGI